ncbi:nuclear transport factor 2 family protein [Paenibacillus polymyxa]|uniref:nuclear transport factor 2 family protein n=1 Tax=Paenibacillus polymyxa TaxID=1406 RepID=UPI000F4E67C7|nr:nuclear transport factor 2 family protein [Paenibacillus polymyxa]RPE00664.1 nuclear transport factor 2 family protein [Paenibacillus polymyxa]
MQNYRIIEQEEKLRKSNVASDVKILNELIHNKLIFVNHFGQVLNNIDGALKIILGHCSTVKLD